MGVATVVLAWRYRMPITAAWSTPGAALLAATGLVDGGWPAAVGAFLVVAALILLTGLWPHLGRLIARIPPSIAQAMLAGVLLPLCVAPITGIVVNPWGVVPVVLTWLVFIRVAPRWAVPLAFVAAAIVVGISLAQAGERVDPALLVPRLALTMPTLTSAPSSASPFRSSSSRWPPRTCRAWRSCAASATKCRGGPRCS